MRLLLQDLRDAGYVIDHIPADRQEFIDELIAGATNDRDYMSEKQIDNADAKLLVSAYRDYYKTLPEKVKQRLEQDWGEAPGDVFFYDDFLLIPGMMNGNILLRCNRRADLARIRIKSIIRQTARRHTIIWDFITGCAISGAQML